MDRTLGPWRWWVLIGTAGVTGVAEAVSRWFGVQSKWVGPTAALAFLWVLFALALGRLSTFRDDNNEWNLGPLRESCAAWWQYAGDRLKEPSFWGALIGIASLIAMAVAQVVALGATLGGLFRQDVAALERSATDVRAIAWLGALGAGVLGAVHLANWWTGEPGPKIPPLPEGGLGRLPVWVGRTELAGQADRCEHPLLADLLRHLRHWPTKRWRFETGYSDDLRHFLRKRLRKHKVERERFVGVQAEGTRGRADLVIQDSVLIELKRELATATADRAVAQVERYAGVWKAGPVVLLLVEQLRPEQRVRVHADMEKLRQRKLPVLVVDLSR
ncbi:MAG: hypothetical protein HOW73_18215 [Polyangiaceae bacterium]|nr:hypothetical protein [Polyangiaceae bacterium]